MLYLLFVFVCSLSSWWIYEEITSNLLLNLKLVEGTIPQDREKCSHFQGQSGEVYKVVCVGFLECCKIVSLAFIYLVASD